MFTWWFELLARLASRDDHEFELPDDALAT
jgi:hypothetical protein